MTAEDSTVISAATRSSVPTESGASAAYSTHTDRITEDIHSDKEGNETLLRLAKTPSQGKMLV